MNLLYVITGLGGGGAEKVVCDLADQMVQMGHVVKIAYLKGKNIVVKPRSNCIELIYLGFESFSKFYSASKDYQQVIKDFNPDVIHAHMVHANIFCRVNRIFQPIPKLICTAHSSNEGGLVRMLAYRYTDYLANISTNVSKKACDEFIAKKAFTESSLFIYNGIDLEKFKKKNSKIDGNSKFRIIAVGRLNYAKDFPNLIQAIKILKDQGYSDFSLSIVGDGEEKENLEKLIHEFELNDFVSLLGRRDDIPELMNNSDLFVLSSLFEGFGLVVAEAMACKTFVISTDCGGVTEVMGNSGILVPPQNSQELAQAIIRVMNMSPEQISQNNERAYKHVLENFDLEIIVKKWLEIYEK